tara:strand:- start:1153 stop:1980 length:828 start_codon:yes stop_codon:yes gene_type:complete
MKNKIYDCTTFYNANLLFELRFNILKDYVDYFVVCEANKDHTGNFKNFNFDPKIPKEYKDKIIYIKVNDLPSIKLKGKKDYKLLSIQMENLHKGIKNAKPDDLIIFSDEDEIINPNAISEFKKENYKFGIFLQNMYYYKFNIMSVDEGNGNWPGTRICKKKNLKSFFNFRLLKVKNLNYPFWRIDKEKSIQLIKKGGWHFSYLMSPRQISQKIMSMAHTEFDKVEFKNEINIIKNIKNLEDLFSRNIKLKKVKIDNTFPRYLRENDEIYKDWILK